MTEAFVAPADAPLSAIPGEAIPGEPITWRRARVLLGWLTPQEGVIQLLGRAPKPDDDLTEVQATIARARSAVARRRPTPIVDPVVPGDRTLLDQVARRPELRAAFPDVQWRLEWVDLTTVLAVEKSITAEGLDARVAAAAADPATLVELCMPAGQPESPTGANRDIDGHGYALSSLNPNLHIVGSNVSEAMVSPSPDVPPLKMQAFTFFVSLGAGYIQVAIYQGRPFLRDGYHRAAGLLRAGITRVPAVVIDAPSYQYIAVAHGLFDHEVAFSDHAPTLADFWDETVSADVLQRPLRRVIRLRADQFFVQA
jgi:hypothetical protein